MAEKKIYVVDSHKTRENIYNISDSLFKALGTPYTVEEFFSKFNNTRNFFVSGRHSARYLD